MTSTLTGTCNPAEHTELQASGQHLRILDEGEEDGVLACNGFYAAWEAWQQAADLVLDHLQVPAHMMQSPDL